MADISKIKTPNGTTYDISVPRNKVGKVGDNYAGGLDAVSTAMIPSHSANKTFGLPANAITIEYSTDGGSTWHDYGATNSQKKSLFMETRPHFYLGKNSSRGTATTNHRLRITIEPTDRYIFMDAVYVWMSTGGNTVYMDMETSTIGNKNTFTSVFKGQQLLGWAGANIRYFPKQAFGGSTNQTTNGYKKRLTFYQTAVNSSYGNSDIQDIRFFGDYVSSRTNNMMFSNHMYSWDADMNVTFPAQVTATKFNGPATKADQLTTARTIDGVDFNGTSAITHYGTCSTAAGTADKTVSISGFKLVTGAVVWVRFTVTNSAPVANLTLNVNSTGAKHIRYRNGNLIYTASLAANKTYPFVYDGTYWQLSCDLDTDNVAQYVRPNAPTVHCGSTAIVANNIIVAGTDGMYKHLKSGTAFDLQRPILRAGSAISANSWGSNNDVYSTFTLTTTQSITLTQGKPVYIKGHLNGTVFTPISTAPLTQTVPTSADGCQYIYLGVAYGSTTMWLDANHPIYQFRDGKFALYEELPNDTLDVQKKQYIQQLKDLCLFAEMANGS